MANTLNLGTDGNWATKEDSLLAYNSENGNFKPLPFDFTRASSATRVNKAGLIETVGSGKPRIDYKDDSKGALLLEPSRSNYIPYSTLDFDGGVKPNGWSIGFGTGSYSYEQLTYKGQKAVKQTQTTTGRSYLDTGSITILANTEHTLKIQFILDECVADADDFIVAFLGFGTDISYRFSDIDANGVLEIQYNPLSDNVGNLRIGLGCNGNEDGGKSLAWAIPQLEQGSYATSYIPTQGGVVTRDAEVCSQTPPSGIIGQTEGTVYFELNNVKDKDVPEISIDDNSNNNRIVVYREAINKYWGIFTSSSGSGSLTNSTTTGENGKFAISYSSSNFSLYRNGVEVVTHSGSLPISLTKIRLNGRASNDQYGSKEYSNLKIYNTRLSNAELQALTTL